MLASFDDNSMCAFWNNKKRLINMENRRKYRKWQREEILFHQNDFGKFKGREAKRITREACTGTLLGLRPNFGQ